MAITLPYSTTNSQYGSTTFSSSRSTSSGTYYNYTTMTSQGYSRINSFTRQSDGSFIASIYINSYSAITRTNTGYTTGTYTLQTTPNIRLYNSVLGTYITVYNAALTTTVGDDSTGSITHSSTVNVTIPSSWFLESNQTWIFNTQQVVTVVTTSESSTHTKTETSFVVPNIFNIWVRYADGLYLVKDIWVRKDDALYYAKSLNVDYNGVIE